MCRVRGNFSNRFQLSENVEATHRLTKANVMIGFCPEITMSKFTMKGRLVVVKLLVLAVFALSLSAKALTFHITYDGSVTTNALAGQITNAYGIVTQTLQTLYTNSSTVNITVYWGANGPFTNGIGLGESQGSLLPYSYSQITNALHNARTTAANSNAVASLPASDPTPAGSHWYVALAEAKALGISTMDGSEYGANNTTINDGNVGFASDIGYNFNPTNRAAVFGDYDFIGVAEHETTEVMGRNTFDLNAETNYVPYDLFRFTASGTRSLNENDSSVYFSVNDGVTVLKYYNSDISGDIQDWATNNPPDSYDWSISNGQAGKLSSADLTAVNVIGYKLNFTPPHLTGTRLGNGNFQLNFTNVTGMSFLVLSSTNLSSASNWTTNGSPTESPAGQYQFTDTQAPANKIRFYRVSLP
jgi:hypothetical protein